MAYRRSTGRRRTASSRGRRVSGYTGVRSGSRVSRTRKPASRSRSGGTRTVRLVIEQAAPSVSPVVGPNGYQIPDNVAPTRAKF